MLERLHDGDVIGELREEESFFESAVAAADDREVLRPSIEGTVAGGAEVDARANEIGLTLGLLALLVVLSPLLAVVGILVRATSQGPAIFAQQRVGLGGKHFAMYKFRSMFADAEQQWDDVRPNNDAGGMLFKMRDDPRVTRIGWTLRRTSIDELPQLVNVLRGQMSLVGPRPLAVAAGEFVGDEQRRHLVKPGITGLWQISGRAQQSWDDAIRLDLYYVENWSLPMDLLILLRTVVTVFRGGAR